MDAPFKKHLLRGLTHILGHDATRPGASFFLLFEPFTNACKQGKKELGGQHDLNSVGYSKLFQH